MKVEINRDVLVSLESTTAKCFADLEAKKKRKENELENMREKENLEKEREVKDFKKVI